MPEVARVSHKHDAIMDFMLANPATKLGEVAAKFEMSQAWLSCVIHSEAFQAALAIRKDLIFHHTVLPIHEKLSVIAHKGLDRMIDKIDSASTPLKETTQITQDALDRLGFTPNSKLPPPAGGNNTQVNVHFTLRNELDNARRLIGQRSAVQPSNALEVEFNGNRGFIALSAEGESQGGAPAELLPNQPDPSPHAGPTTGGAV